jgi:methylmalonyl-CoA mutase cobalamin-binding subunit
MKKKIVGAAIGNCVHVAGLHHFLKLAESEGYETISLGPAVPVERLVASIGQHRPDITAVSYRLTPEVSAGLFENLKAALASSGLGDIQMVFGGTPAAAETARETGLFAKVFGGGETIGEIRAFLRGGSDASAEETFAGDLIGRIERKYPYPIIRHHFGRPSLDETIAGVAMIAESGVVDVISLGPDQNAQEHFFHPENMDRAQDGAGGVPLRRPGDLAALYENSRRGNHPLMRCYSGTRDLIPWAEMSVETIHNAWGAIPLCWYSIMDGRSRLHLVEAMEEKLSAIRWYAGRGIPVEVNESHQWSLRDAHDSLAVAMAFLAAYNAKKAGVRRYVSQYMFNTPPGTWPNMDIAKMLAKNELIETLAGENFSVFREVRAGIAHFSSVPSIAKGQLSASAVISLALKPHILHVVGFSEGDHAVFPEELIESCQIVHGVLSDCLSGLPDMESDVKVRERRDELIAEARILLDAIARFGAGMSEDPWSEPRVFAAAIKNGLLDTPHFRGNPHLCGKILTRLIDGAWHAVDEASGERIGEKERTERILNSG